jgi:hypothetical protein
MDNIEYLQIRGLIDIPSIRPYEAKWVISQIDELLINDVKLNPLDRKIISLFNLILTKKQDLSYLVHLSGAYQLEPEYGHGFLDAN